MIVLGFETSCDETAVGIVDADRRILGHALATQFEAHKPYGGVVPEIAARAHMEKIDDLLIEALRQADLSLSDIAGVAATCGPGLIGGVMVGAMTGKAIASVRGIPFSAVNHLEAHALTARLTDDVAFPYLLLLVSGGHCQLVLVRDVCTYERLGSTIDDAVGECFDKTAKLLGLGYPGGPLLEKAALAGDARAYSLPRPLFGRKGCDFSFSGLKTAVRNVVEQHGAQQGALTQGFVADIAASTQSTIAAILEDRTRHALEALLERNSVVSSLVVAGGVASNKAIRETLTLLAASFGIPFVAPPVSLCTDNGVMVAWAGLERLRLGLSDPLDFKTRPRWPLGEGR